MAAYVAGSEAFEAYLAAEAAEQDDIEVLLLRAESDAALRAAYPHYFVGGSRRQRMHQIMIGLDEVPA